MNREEIEKRVQHDLARGPGPPDSDEMCSVDKHVTDCLKEVVTGYLCPYERYETAKRQHKNLKLPGQLRDCARDTRLADELEIFNNMVLGSYIYDLHNEYVLAVRLVYLLILVTAFGKRITSTYPNRGKYTKGLMNTTVCNSTWGGKQIESWQRLQCL